MEWCTLILCIHTITQEFIQQEGGLVHLYSLHALLYHCNHSRDHLIWPIVIGIISPTTIGFSVAEKEKQANPNLAEIKDLFFPLYKQLGFQSNGMHKFVPNAQRRIP